MRTSVQRNDHVDWEHVVVSRIVSWLTMKDMQRLQLELGCPH